MPNQPIENHRWLNHTGTYRADLPAVDTITTATVVAPGMEVQVIEAFADWNDVSGLDMLYVFVPATGYSTHVTPSDLGWSQPVMCDGLPLGQTTCPDRAGHM